MDSIYQAKLKSSHLLHKMALIQSQRSRTVALLKVIKFQFREFQARRAPSKSLS